jgi:hypothetical protein
MIKPFHCPCLNVRQILPLLFLALAVVAPLAFAQALDGKAVLDALVHKGILSSAEADQIVTDATTVTPANLLSPGKVSSLQKLEIYGKFQIQYAGLGTVIEGAVVQPPATQHFLVRRFFIGTKAAMAGGWSASLNYDFSGATLDQAFITWKKDEALAVDVGFRKVPFAYDEFSSCLDIRSIERSPVTRYFVESNNGRRLGAGSYRTGVFVGGSQGGFFYNAAATNPERNESASGVTGSGDKTNNLLAYWGNAGYAGTVLHATYKVGSAVGFLPDQGGKVLGTGHDLTVYDLYTEITSGGFNFRAEYLGSINESGRSALRDARSYGFDLQPSYRVGNLEAAVRYSFIDSDGRGVDLADTLRSAPSGGTMNKLTDWFMGGNYYFRGNDLKLQFGYTHAVTQDLISASSSSVLKGQGRATADGVRSQLQFNF